MTPVCPSCGYNLERELPIEDGPFAYDPTGPEFKIDGRAVQCRRQVREMLGGLMHARGRTLPFDAIAGRLGSEAHAAARLIDVALYEARRMFEESPYPCPIERVRGEGLRWVRK